MSAHRDRAHVGRRDRRDGVRLGHRHEPERRGRDRAPRSEPAEDRSGRAGDRGAAHRARARAPLRGPRLVAGRPARRVSRSGGSRALRRRRELEARADRGARRRLRPALLDAPAHARPAARRRRRARVGLGGAGVRGDRRSRTRRLDRSADHARGGERWAQRRLRGRDARPRRSRRRGGRSSVRLVKHRFISFLTDFGLTDDFVGTCHGVMKRIAPDVQIIDVTHGITPQGVLAGALVLRNTLRYLPNGVHLAVVDPGVGSARRPVIIRDAEGDLYVGPDNGLLFPAAELRGIDSAHELANPAYALEPVSRTFHGRDLFSPAAAHLALGVEPSELGPPLATDALVRLDLPRPVIDANKLDARVLSIDRFGNMQLNMTREDLDQVGIVPGTRFEVEVAGERYYATAARTYADARPGEIVLYEDSYRNVAIAINRGSAAEMFASHQG